jgi:hypothetical protein
MFELMIGEDRLRFREAFSSDVWGGVLVSSHAFSILGLNGVLDRIVAVIAAQGACYIRIYCTMIAGTSDMLAV